MAKTLSVAIQQLSAVSFNQSQGVTLESESTCSHVPPGLRRDWQACQQATWNTWEGKTARQTAVLLLSESAICCFVFSLWIRANKDNRESWTLISGFISFCANSCILKLTYQLHAAGSVRSPMSPNTVPSDVVKNPNMHVWISVWEAYWLTSFSRNIEREDAAAHRDTFSHAFHREKITILMIYRS